MTIKYYKSRNWVKSGVIAYFLVDLDDFTPSARGDRNDTYLCYSPIGQHGQVIPAYLRYNSIKISQKEYLQATKGFYTPEDYLKCE